MVGLSAVTRGSLPRQDGKWENEKTEHTHTSHGLAPLPALTGVSGLSGLRCAVSDEPQWF